MPCQYLLLVIRMLQFAIDVLLSQVNTADYFNPSAAPWFIVMVITAINIQFINAASLYEEFF